MIFQRISDDIRHMLSQDNIIVWNYIDDIFAAWESQGSIDKFETLCNLVRDLGLPLNDEKVEPPSDSMIIMGIHINVPERTIEILANKMEEIVQECNGAYEMSVLTKRQLQSLLGKLLYISKVIKPARGFLNRMLNCLRSMGNNGRIQVTGEFRQDLRWFKELVNHFNGSTTFSNWLGQYDIEVHVDASLTGLGAIWGYSFYSVHLPIFVKEQSRIVVLEMINILVAMRVGGVAWVDKRVKIWCDNKAVVDIIGGNKTRDGELAAILREILMIQARHNIQLVVQHVMGSSNEIADALSRVNMQKSVDCKLDLLQKGYIEYVVDSSAFTLSLEL